MASGTKLELVFGTSSGSVTMNFNYADPDASTEDVTALMNGIIANGAIFEKVPTSIKSASIVEITETILNVTN